MSLVAQLQEAYKNDAAVQAANKKEFPCHSEWKCKGQISLYYQVHESYECLNCGCRIAMNCAALQQEKNGVKWYTETKGHNTINTLEFDGQILTGNWISPTAIFSTLADMTPEERAHYHTHDEYMAAIQAKMHQKAKTLITIDVIESEVNKTNAKPYLIKILAPTGRHPATKSRHATEDEAIQALEQMEQAEPGKYTRVSAYSMEKEASAS